MAETTLVDERLVCLLSLYDICLRTLGHLLQTLRVVGRSLARVDDHRMGSKGDGTNPLGDIRRRCLRLLENEILDVALGRGL